MWVLGQYYFAEHPKLEACSGTVVARNQARTSYLQWKPNMIRTETNDLNFPSKAFEPISYPNLNLYIIPYLNASFTKKKNSLPVSEKIGGRRECDVLMFLIAREAVFLGA